MAASGLYLQDDLESMCDLNNVTSTCSRLFVHDVHLAQNAFPGGPGGTGHCVRDATGIELCKQTYRRGHKPTGTDEGHEARFSSQTEAPSNELEWFAIPEAAPFCASFRHNVQPRDYIMTLVVVKRGER